MNICLKTNRAYGWVIGLIVLSVSACNAAPAAPATYVALVTQVVPVTQIYQVTQIVQSTQMVDVTRVVPVTQVVPVVRIGQGTPIEVTRLVMVEVLPPEVTRLVYVETLPPAPTQAPPAPTAAPAVATPPEIPPAPVPTPSPVPPSANPMLLVYYDFEGDFLTSGVVADRSGNGQDARLTRAAGVGGGVAGGQAIVFTGYGYLQAQRNPMAGRNAASFSLWFKTDHPENNYKLASAAWWNGGPGSGWIMATHMPEFWSDDTRGLYLPDIYIADNQFVAGAWNHEVVTYDGQRIREYTNGRQVNDWPTTAAALGQGQPMVVGAWPPYSAYNFQGSLDEFQLFSAALAPEAVLEIYNRGR